MLKDDRRSGVNIGRWEPGTILGFCLTFLVSSLIGCGGAEPGDDTGGAPLSGGQGAVVAEALAVAEEYVDGYFEQFPEEASETGYPAPLDRVGRRAKEDMDQWRAREDSWLERLRALDSEELEGTEAAVPYAFALDRLEVSVARRVCAVELWNVSPTWTGWHEWMAAVFFQQPVGSQPARADALARARDLPRHIDAETANSRLGVEMGYTAPRSNVEAVIRQMDALLALAPEETPYFSPASRDDDEVFAEELRTVIVEEIQPATRRYRDYLATEYLPSARTEIGVTSNPGGRECYLASVRFYATLPLSPEEIHEMGLREMERIQAEMREIGRRSFGTEDILTLLERARTNPDYTFETAQEIIEYAQEAIDRAKAAMPDWFGFVPKADVVLKPYPDYMQRTGGGYYSAGSADGSRPGTYEFGTYEPRALSKAGGFEATTFHETYPGHHMQVYVALEGAGVHPVLQYFFTSGLGEGWALYSERLAEEMGLYTSDVDRLGMLSSEAFRAARLVVDPGMHVLGWSRKQAIDYMLANTASSEGEITEEVDRYIAVPAQATSYLVGSLVIHELRAEAEEVLGDDFDIREFHDLVIEDGTITLVMLQEKIQEWIEEQAKGLGRA